ncbi:MAG: hypothetical protein K6T56_05745 [Burkholderiales bacterium]|nr:hypothetical protein [Burkholderiales bacterium]
MPDWNVVITARDQGFARACELLAPLASLQSTAYYNVMVGQAADPLAFLAEAERVPGIESFVARIVPVTVTFHFQSPEEFESQAGRAALPWLEELAGSRFHVRMHRRGFRGRLVSPVEERFLDHFLIDHLQAKGATAQVDFDDPDFILAVETVDQQAGLSLWSRTARAQHPLLRLD